MHRDSYFYSIFSQLKISAVLIQQENCSCCNCPAPGFDNDLYLFCIVRLLCERGHKNSQKTSWSCRHQLLILINVTRDKKHTIRQEEVNPPLVWPDVCVSQLSEMI